MILYHKTIYIEPHPLELNMNNPPRFQPDQVILGNCIAGMKEMPEESIDLVITDPPFAIDFKAQRTNYNRTGSRVLEGYREIPAEDYPQFTHDWMQGVWRILKDTGSVYIFSGWNNLKDILVAADSIGFTTVNHIIWKYQFGVVTKRKFVTSHYHCLFLCKDDRKRQFYPFERFGKDEKTAQGGSAHYKDKEDVWYIKREYWTGDKKTPTKLPRELIEKILTYSSAPGDTVFDPFMGSGQVAVVSKLLKRHYYGFEIVEEYHAFISERLSSGSYRLSADDVDVKQSENNTEGLLFSEATLNG